MAFASGSSRGAAYVEENTFGTTPASPSMKTLRQTSFGLGLTRSTLSSDERREDRQLHDLRTGVSTVSGDIGAELMYGEFDDLIEAVMCEDWSSDTLKFGSKMRSFTFEDRFTDIGLYRVYTGNVIDTMQVEAQPGDTGALVTATFGAIGSGMSKATTQLGSPAAPLGNVPFSTCDGTIKIDNTEIKVFSNLQFTIANNYGADYVIGSCSAANITQGQIEVTGALECFVEDGTYLGDFIDETEIEVDVSFKDIDGNTLEFNFPRVRLTSADPDNADKSITETLNFSALYDSTDDTTMTVTRTAHP